MDDSNEGSDVSYDPLNDAELTSDKRPQAKRKTGRISRGSILERRRRLHRESDDGADSIDEGSDVSYDEPSDSEETACEPDGDVEPDRDSLQNEAEANRKHHVKRKNGMNHVDF